MKPAHSFIIQKKYRNKHYYVFTDANMKVSLGELGSTSENQRIKHGWIATYEENKTELPRSSLTSHWPSQTH